MLLLGDHYKHNLLPLIELRPLSVAIACVGVVGLNLNVSLRPLQTVFLRAAARDCRKLVELQLSWFCRDTV